MRHPGFAGLAGRDRSHAKLLVGKGVISRDSGGVSLAHQITARIAGVRDNGVIVAEGARHDGGGHIAAGWSGGQTCFKHFGIGGLHKARQESVQRFTAGRFAKAFQHAFNGNAGGHFTTVVSTDSIGKSKQPAVRARLFFTRRSGIAKKVFVVVAYSSRIGELRKLNI